MPKDAPRVKPKDGLKGELKPEDAFNANPEDALGEPKAMGVLKANPIF